MIGVATLGMTLPDELLHALPEIGYPYIIVRFHILIPKSVLAHTMPVQAVLSCQRRFQAESLLNPLGI